MCTYNGSPYLQEQLESIASQQRPPDELIVCDDCSKDNTKEIIEAFAAQSAFPVRLFVNEENLGSIKNFEKAIKLSAGEIIVLSDQDDVWHPEKLEALEAALAVSPDTGMVFSDAELVDQNLKPLGYELRQIFLNRRYQRLVESGRGLEVLLSDYVVTGATMAFRASFKEQILPIPESQSLIHDAWIALVIASLAEIAFIEKPLIKYRQHPNQQLGVTIPGEVLKTKSASDETRDSSLIGMANFYLARRDEFLQLRNRLTMCAAAKDIGKSLRLIEARIDSLQRQATHFQSRARAQQSGRGLSRLSFVLKEFLMFRYYRYSHGARSAARDLLD
jgi:glycosyltransferase involved in cell wall biosynthesis